MVNLVELKWGAGERHKNILFLSLNSKLLRLLRIFFSDLQNEIGFGKKNNIIHREQRQIRI